MKKIREYHIESYWAEVAERRERRAELKEKAKLILGVSFFVGLYGVIVWEFLNQLFGVM